MLAPFALQELVKQNLMLRTAAPFYRFAAGSSAQEAFLGLRQPTSRPKARETPWSIICEWGIPNIQTVRPLPLLGKGWTADFGLLFAKFLHIQKLLKIGIRNISLGLPGLLTCTGRWWWWEPEISAQDLKNSSVDRNSIYIYDDRAWQVPCIAVKAKPLFPEHSLSTLGAFVSEAPPSRGLKRIRVTRRSGARGRPEAGEGYLRFHKPTVLFVDFGSKFEGVFAAVSSSFQTNPDHIMQHTFSGSSQALLARHQVALARKQI